MVMKHNYHIVENVQGPKLLWLGHHVSIHRKTFAYAAKQRQQVPKHFENHRKTFQPKTAKTAKLWPSNILYYTVVVRPILFN